MIWHSDPWIPTCRFSSRVCIFGRAALVKLSLVLNPCYLFRRSSVPEPGLVVGLWLVLHGGSLTINRVKMASCGEVQPRVQWGVDLIRGVSGDFLPIYDQNPERERSIDRYRRGGKHTKVVVESWSRTLSHIVYSNRRGSREVCKGRHHKTRYSSGTRSEPGERKSRT